MTVTVRQAEIVVVSRMSYVHDPSHCPTAGTFESLSLWSEESRP